MGNSPLSACQGGNGPQVFSVVRTAAWGLSSTEDVWEVEIPGTATVAELKAQVEELYEVPRDAQRLARTAEESAPVLEDDVKVSTLERRKVYLLPPVLPPGLEGLGGLFQPSPEEEVAMSEMLGGLFGAATENMEVQAAMEESLQGVSYKVNFKRPASAGGKAAGKQVTLTLDALAVISTVQEMVELELFGDLNSEPAFLSFQGKMLPPFMKLYQAGVEEGATIEVVKEQPPMASMPGGAGLPMGMGMGMGMPPPEQLQQMLGGLLGGPQPGMAGMGGHPQAVPVQGSGR